MTIGQAGQGRASMLRMQILCCQRKKVAGVSDDELCESYINPRGWPHLVGCSQSSPPPPTTNPFWTSRNAGNTVQPRIGFGTTGLFCTNRAVGHASRRYHGQGKREPATRFNWRPAPRWDENSPPKIRGQLGPLGTRPLPRRGPEEADRAQNALATQHHAL